MCRAIQSSARDEATLMAVAESIATQVSDGKLSVFRMQSGWRTCFGTPTRLREADDAAFKAIPLFPTLSESLAHLIAARPVRIEAQRPKVQQTANPAFASDGSAAAALSEGDEGVDLAETTDGDMIPVIVRVG